MVWVALTSMAVATAAPVVSEAAPSFTEAKIVDGRVVAQLSTGRRPAFRELECSVGNGPKADQLKMSPDRRHLGWAVTCETGDETYPIPEEVVVYAAGTRAPQRFNNGLAVTSWRFISDRRVEICTDTVHGGFKPSCGVHTIGPPSRARPGDRK